jgi:hypothetical protein
MSAPKDLGSTDGEVFYLADLPYSDLVLLGYIDGRIRVVRYDPVSERLERRELAGHSGAVIRAAEAPCEPLVAVLYDRMIMLYEPEAIVMPALPRGLIPLPAIATALAWDTRDAKVRALLVGDEQSWWMRMRVGTVS